MPKDWPAAWLLQVGAGEAFPQSQTLLPKAEAPHSATAAQQSWCHTWESIYLAVTVFGTLGRQVEPTLLSMNRYLADSGRVKIHLLNPQAEGEVVPHSPLQRVK